MRDWCGMPATASPDALTATDWPTKDPRFWVAYELRSLTANHRVRLKVGVPEPEQHLTSVTGGRGSYHMEYSHYDEVPNHLQSKIIATSKAERGQMAEEPA